MEQGHHVQADIRLGQTPAVDDEHGADDDEVQRQRHDLLLPGCTTREEHEANVRALVRLERHRVSGQRLAARVGEDQLLAGREVDVDDDDAAVGDPRLREAELVRRILRRDDALRLDLLDIRAELLRADRGVDGRHGEVGGDGHTGRREEWPVGDGDSHHGVLLPILREGQPEVLDRPLQGSV